jgi:hypothetical protein
MDRYRSLTLAAPLRGGMALALLLAATPLAAQRPPSSTYDPSRHVTLKGAVTRIDWVNPRAFIFINVTDAGAVANWAVEIGNPLDLEQDGWKRTSLRIGDVVNVEGLVALGQTKQVLATSVVLASTGKPLFAPAKPRPSAARLPAPRWPDGRVRLGPPPGKKGYWGPASATALVENGATADKGAAGKNPGPILMNKDGLLRNLSDAARVAPFQPWARALYEYRQRRLLADDPTARCLPNGGPRLFHTPPGFQFVEQRELGRILVLAGGGNRNWRIIYTDGRPQGQPDEVVRTYYGNSVGHWEGDTLVVDAIGYNERFWFTSGGLPHTEALHLTERFSRPDLNTLKYEVTVDDPRAYTRAWTGGWTVQWVPDEEIQEFFCEENAESTFVR